MLVWLVEDLVLHVRKRTRRPRYRELAELLGVAAPVTFGPHTTYESVRLWVSRNCRSSSGPEMSP